MAKIGRQVTRHVRVLFLVVLMIFQRYLCSVGDIFDTLQEHRLVPRVGRAEQDLRATPRVNSAGLQRHRLQILGFHGDFTAGDTDTVWHIRFRNFYWSTLVTHGEATWSIYLYITSVIWCEPDKHLVPSFWSLFKPKFDVQTKQHQTTYCNSSTAKPKKPKHNQEGVGCGSAAGKAVRNARSHLRQPQQRIIHRGHVAVVKLHDCIRKKTCERCVCVCVLGFRKVLDQAIFSLHIWG